jgi:8-oxo-dGTP pyrophosphatase MutT (NUDIX family)
MKTLTLAFLFRGEKILLAMKKRRFGAGKWNGYGGKIEEGEEPIDAIVREVKEESNLDVKKESFKELGYIDFYFDNKEEWNQRVIIYKVSEFSGEPEETEEMTPKWFDLDKIPYQEMWAGDDIWLPKVINGENIKGEAHFTESGEKLVSCEIR